MDSLHTLARQVERKRQLVVLRDHARGQLRELTEKIQQLKAQWQKEQQDVERLEKASLTALFYELLGKKQERLEQEQREALAAAAKYRSAQVELDSLRLSLDSYEAELRELAGCDAAFEAAKQARGEELKAARGETGRRIVELEETLGTLENLKRELDEAFSAGRKAAAMAREVQEELDNAESWGTWDLLGGGLVTQIAKHDHLDQAQRLVEQLQNQLRQFKTELADVEIHADMDVRVDDFLRFADWFFDGLIVDWAVQSKIEDAQDRVYDVQEQIARCMARLERMQSDTQKKQWELQQELETLLLKGEAT